jgi:putative transposase
LAPRLSLTLPPAVPQEDAEGFCRDVAAELEQFEAAAHREAERQGLRFLGQRRVREVSPYDRATSFEALRARNPTFAVGREQGSAWPAAAAAVRTFRASYRAALKRWRGGERDAVFPTGTWWMRVFHGAAVPSAVLTV